MKQSGGIRGPSTVNPGQPITVEVSNGATSVTVVVDGDPGQEPTEVPVDADGTAHLPPQPGWTAGKTLLVTTNTVPPKTLTIQIVDTN